ncbi:ABC transporter substrate-binding protein, partial [Candidatus Magnetomorum sp. HK-1]
AKKCQIILLKPTSMNAIYHHIQTIGQIFKQVEKAQKCISDIQTQLHLISEKVSEIPENKRKRVARLMGRDSLMTPGINSFQNEYIRAAGGIPHSIDKKGQIIPVTLAEWKNFNPQMIYGCGGDRYLEDTLFQKSGWKDVDAIKQGNIHYFPCELTCRASTQTAYFVTWLSATLYPELFQEKAKKIYPEKIFQTQDVDLSLSFVRTAKIAFSHVNDLVCKTLMIDFKHPQY